jgi:thiazole tautomerase (transcriptional regulator TenI)
VKLMAVTDDRHPVSELASLIIGIKDIIDFVQIREKTKNVQEIVRLLEHLEDGGVKKEKIIINDRLDIALLMKIPNLHLPEQGLPVKKVKAHFPHLRIGRSVHSLEKRRGMVWIMCYMVIVSRPIAKKEGFQMAWIQSSK